MTDTPTREQAIDALADGLHRSFRDSGWLFTYRQFAEAVVAHLSAHPEQATALGIGHASLIGSVLDDEDHGDAFTFVDRETHEPCPTHGKALCTNTDPDHLHVARHMLSTPEPDPLAHVKVGDPDPTRGQAAQRVERRLAFYDKSPIGNRCVTCGHVKHNDLGYCQNRDCDCEDGTTVAGLASMIRRDLAARPAVWPAQPETEAWECKHYPRCADAACSYNPAMQRMNVRPETGATA